MKPLLEQVPLEVVDTIIDMVAADDRNDKNLRACSLTCQSFLPRCRKHIFYSIQTATVVEAAIFDKFSKLISDAPWITHHVRLLQFVGLLSADAVGRMNQSKSLSVFDRLPRLHTLVLLLIDPSKDTVWVQMPPSVQATLLCLMHLPTIVRLELSSIHEFLLSDLAPCANLKYLVLSDVQLKGDIDGFPSDMHNKLIKLDRLNLHTDSAQDMAIMQLEKSTNVKPIFDLRELKYITFQLNRAEQCHFEILKHARHLETIDLSFDVIPTASDITSLLLISLGSLRFLSIYIHCFKSDTVSLLCGGLQMVAGCNLIEGLTVNLLVDHTEPHIRENQWNLFDKVLLASDQLLQWPSLRRFDLTFYLDTSDTSYQDQDQPVESYKKLEDALLEVRDAQLSRLGSNKSFDFKFSFIHDSEEYHRNLYL